MKSLKEKPGLFLATVETVKPRRVVDSTTVLKANLGSRICKFSECKEKTNIKQIQETLRKIDRILAFVVYDSRKLIKTTRKCNSDKRSQILQIKTKKR